MPNAENETLENEQRYRAGAYGLLAAMLRSAPEQTLLDQTAPTNERISKNRNS